jgi:hypothetical protein
MFGGSYWQTKSQKARLEIEVYKMGELRLPNVVETVSSS